MSVVNEIRRNNRERTAITMDVSREPSEVDLLHALERNTFIMVITVYIGVLPLANHWNLLARAIATRENLEKVTLEVLPGDPALAQMLPQFLQAAESNPSVKEIMLRGFRFVLGSELFTYLCTTFEHPALKLYGCDMANPAQSEQGGRALATRNLSIQNYDGRFMIQNYDGGFMASLVPNLGQNSNLMNLCLATPPQTALVGCYSSGVGNDENTATY